MTVLRASRAKTDQQDQPHSGKQVKRDHRQQNFYHNTGANRYPREVAPAHQANTHNTATDAGHREQAVDRFSNGSDPKYVAKSHAPIWVIRTQESEPGDGE